MVHITTVHWFDDRWVDIQLKYLSKNIKSPFKVYSFLNGLANDHSSKYFYSSNEPIESHAIKLNLLADIASLNAANDDDLLMFLDGDAFPIGDVLSLWDMKSQESPIIAVQRRENNGDLQPHPCFCLTTIGFWKKIKGDWKHGYQWRDAQGKSVTDVGGNMLKILNNNKISWHPLLRSNKRELHPLWFGIYDGVVYHHGAAFRNPTSRADVASLDDFSRFRFTALEKLPKIFKKIIPKRFQPLCEIAKKNRSMSERVFEKIQKNTEFYRYFQIFQEQDSFKGV